MYVLYVCKLSLLDEEKREENVSNPLSLFFLSLSLSLSLCSSRARPVARVRFVQNERNREPSLSLSLLNPTP